MQFKRTSLRLFKLDEILRIISTNSKGPNKSILHIWQKVQSTHTIIW